VAHRLRGVRDAQGNAYIAGKTASTNFPLASPVQNQYNGGEYDAFVAKLSPPNRVVTYTYDGLLRLIGAVESPGNTYAYGYDSAGNRTSVQVNGGTPTSFIYNAANEVAGWTYDNAGNLTGDGTATYSYDALNRTKTVTAGSQTRTNTYNGDGVLVTQVANATTTRYTQDLATSLTQILQTTQGSATTNYLYGAARLASLAGSTRTWYAADGLGCVRRTVADTGTPNAPMLSDTFSIRHSIIPVRSPRSPTPTPHQ